MGFIAKYADSGRICERRSESNEEGCKFSAIAAKQKKRERKKYSGCKYLLLFQVRENLAKLI